MQIAFKTKNFKLTKRIKKYLQDKLLKFNSQLPQETFIEIKLEDIYGPRGGKDKCVQIAADIPGETRITVEEKTSDIFASIDIAFQRFSKRVYKIKEKFLVKRRKQKIGAVVSKFTGWIPKAKAFRIPFIKNKSSNFQEINIEREAINLTKSLTDDEAVEALKKSKLSFSVFVNKYHKINIIYQIKRNHFKIFEPLYKKND